MTSDTRPSSSAPAKREWAPRMWQGCNAFAWWRLLWRNRLAVDVGALDWRRRLADHVQLNEAAAAERPDVRVVRLLQERAERRARRVKLVPLKEPLVISGPGAGAEVTAAGILNDIYSLAAR